MRAQRQDDLRVAEQAAEWAATLDSADPQQHAEFVAWLRQSARHVEEFLLASAVYRELDGVDAERREDIERLMAEGGSNVVALGKYPPAPASSDGGPVSPPGGWKGEKRATWRRTTTLAACASAIAVIGWLVSSPGWESYETDIGEQRAVELEDGSLVHLNTRSEVQVRLSAAGRDIRLRHGEALFKVMRDPARPFRVHTDRAVIQALGTQFNVQLRRDETKVSVIEGSVRVLAEGSQDSSRPLALPSPHGRGEGKEGGSRQTNDRRTSDARDAELAAGQETSVTREGQITAIAAADMAKTVAWRQRRLVFSNDRLADVAAEFNRYNRSPRIRIEDERASERRLTAVFDADAPESLVRFLADADELSVDRDGETVVIRWRFDR